MLFSVCDLDYIKREESQSWPVALLELFVTFMMANLAANHFAGGLPPTGMFFFFNHETLYSYCECITLICLIGGFATVLMPQEGYHFSPLDADKTVVPY